MIDLKITASGDMVTDKNGDLCLTGVPSLMSSDEDTSVIAAQMAYMAIKTEMNDFLFHPYLGIELYKLLGLPNKKETGKLGEKLILEALQKWNVPGSITVKSYPLEQQKIRFEIKIETGNPSKFITLTLDKILNEIGL